MHKMRLNNKLLFSSDNTKLVERKDKFELENRISNSNLISEKNLYNHISYIKLLY